MASFDPVAETYDQDFTRSLTGVMQRQAVRNFIDRHLRNKEPLKILELGCGTGEDAIYLASCGHHVTATDISESMITIARAKAVGLELPGELCFETLDMRKLANHKFDMHYDAVLSNFGGMNCLNPAELTQVFESIYSILKTEGRIFAVVMPSFCLWESAYFFLKGQWRSIFRRLRKEGIIASIGGSEIQTWYYSPGHLSRLTGKNFKAVRVRPVGFFVPPSYLEAFFSNRQGLLRLLGNMERMVSGVSFFSVASDHFICELKRRR